MNNPLVPDRPKTPKEFDGLYTTNPSTPSPTPAGPYSGPNRDVRGSVGGVGVHTKLDLTDPQQYYDARRVNAANGRWPGDDPRSSQIGRSPEGAQQLRDASEIAAAGAAGVSGSNEALAYGEDIYGDLNARAAATPVLGAEQQKRGDAAVRFGTDYGDYLDTLGGKAVASGLDAEKNIRTSATRGANAIRGVNATELPSVARSSFQLGTDRAIQDAARTGNISGAADVMSRNGMDASRIRAGEEANWRNAQLRDIGAGADMEMLGARTAADAARGGYDTAVGLTSQGAGLRQQGFENQFLGNKSFADSARERGRFVADTHLGASNARAQGNINAADAVFDATDLQYGALGNINDVNNLEAKGSMAREEDRIQRSNAYIAYLNAEREAERIDDAAFESAVAQGIVTGLILL
jgi:hypothetical protein